MRIVQNLNNGWMFTREAVSDPGRPPANYTLVDLPHTWNGKDGQDGGNDYYRGTCLYAKELETADLPEGKQYYLEINGANSSADVYVNGIQLAHHDGGYSTWRVDITAALKEEKDADGPDEAAFASHKSGSILLAIAVDNSANDHVYPQQADFTFYGGLYRDVNLIALPASHFELEEYGTPGIRVTPLLESDTAENALVTVETFVVNGEEGLELICTIRDADGNIVGVKRQVSSGSHLPLSPWKVTFHLENVHRWNGKKDPYLYTAEITLVRRGSAPETDSSDNPVLDSIRTRFGCRTYAMDPDQGFILNGESYPLRGVSRHQDRPGIGNALRPEHHREDIDLILEMGANTVRLAHYQHDQLFYDLCDEKGLIVWAEIPYISMHLPNGRDNTVSQMKELVTQNYNHPSIVVWGLSNEITVGGTTGDLLENHRLLNDLVHELDPTRKTAVAAVSSCDIHNPYLQIPDVVSYNLYYGWYEGTPEETGPWLDRFHKEFPKIPIGLSEYGCEALNWHSSAPRKGDYTEEYQSLYHESLIRQISERPYLWATHVWNMFDFAADARSEGGSAGMNDKGLVTFDRKYRKDAFYAYKAWLSDEPFVHICGKRYVDRAEEITRVKIYSNLPKVELFANEVSLGVMTSEDLFFDFEVPNSSGETLLRAIAFDECEKNRLMELHGRMTPVTDESRIRKVDNFNEAYRLKEKGSLLNWFDITEPEGFFSVNDTLDNIMKTTTGDEYVRSMLRRLMGARADMMIESPTFAMIRTFTVMRIFNTPRVLGGEDKVPTKETMILINKELNQIPKNH